VSVRVCYLQRAGRGAQLRGVRLMGQTTDESWVTPGDGGLPDYDEAARWVRERLGQTRSTSSVAMLCLDVDGGVCSWLNVPGQDAAVVAAVARGSVGDAVDRHGPFEFFAPTDAESTIQALGTAGGPASGRMPVLGLTDLPARLLIDALDRQRIPVESAATLWHAMAGAWDPGAPRSGDAGEPTDSSPLTGVIVIDPAGRLVWCWCRAGRLLVGGSQRLRVGALVAPGGEPPGDEEVLYGPEEVPRLTAEWLTWAAQVGQAPRRIVCVLTQSDQAAPFGAALGEAWRGAVVDAAQHDDPIGATLRRMADRLEATPQSKPGMPEASSGLAALSGRPGQAHRRMHLWRAGAVAALAMGVGLGAWQLRRSAAEASEAARGWNERWTAAIKDVDPTLTPRAGESLLTILRSELQRREQEMLPPERSDVTMPVMQELETISMVLSSVECDLERLQLDSGQAPSMSVLFKTNQDGEQFIAGLNRIAGSFTQNWTVARTSQRGTAGSDETRLVYSIRGEWNRDLVKPPKVAPQ